jgi:ferric-dicitrate binding protein FerR (iron transport regulator)
MLQARLGDRLVVRVLPGSRIALPRGPGRLFGHHRTLRVEEGGLFASTGGRGLGFELDVASPCAVTTVRGTTFAVLRIPHGTCVCLLEGEIRLRTDAGDEVTVEAGHRVQVFDDGREPRREALVGQERAMLETLRLASR